MYERFRDVNVHGISSSDVSRRKGREHKKYDSVLLFCPVRVIRGKYWIMVGLSKGTESRKEMQVTWEGRAT